MNARTRDKLAMRGLPLGLLGIVVGLGFAVQPSFSTDDPPQVSGQSKIGAAAGMTVHVDPQTGALRREPAAGTAPLQLSPQLQNALSTSHQGLVETPSPVPGGGIKVDLQGRFQSPLMVTIGSD